MRRWSHLFAIAVAASISLAIGSTSATAQTLEKPKLIIGVGGKSLFYYLPLTIAERQGYFKAEGLDVEIQDFPGGTRALQALLGGSVDVVSGAYEHTISQQAKGQNIEALIMQGKYAGIVLAMSKAKAAHYETGKDLKGMKIGVTAPGSSTNMFVNILLAKDGLNPDDVSIIGVGASAGAVAAMKRGEIDAIANLDPVITMLQSSGDFVSVVDTRTQAGMINVYGLAYAAGCIYVPTEFTKKYPNTAQAVVNAMMRALRFIQATPPDQLVDAVPPEYYTDRNLYKLALLRNIETYRHDGIITEEAGRNVLRDLKTFDPTVQNAKIDIAKTINMTFAQKAGLKYR